MHEEKIGTLMYIENLSTSCFVESRREGECGTFKSDFQFVVGRCCVGIVA
jgi:hypothetical protein